MEPSDFPPGRSPRKELQGPRPAPLKIHKESHKIRKPPMAPPQPSQAPGSHHPPRQPVIIYTVSPKIIHTNPSDFMNLVQRLTGLSSSSSEAASTTTSATTSTTTTNPNLYNMNRVGRGGGAAISPAARYATIEKANSPQGVRKMINMKSSIVNHDQHVSTNVLEIGLDQMESSFNCNNKGLFSGILSPGPASLPPIPPNFFSPLSDSFFHDLSPVIHSNKNFIEGSFMPSPAANSSSFFVSPRNLMTSPTTPSIDHFLFNNIFSDNL